MPRPRGTQVTGWASNTLATRTSTTPPVTRVTELWPRWLFLRAVGLVFASAFISLAVQIQGLTGSQGILPARNLLESVAAVLPVPARCFELPTLLWLWQSDAALTALCILGTLCSVLLILNLFPRLAVIACTLLFLSFVSAARDFSGYQSDGMLLEAGFLAAFLAPAGMRPGLGEDRPVSFAALWLLRWEWFRIYFESGVVKILSGDAQWRGLTALDHYYENLPLPSFAGYWVQQLLPHSIHAATCALVLGLELAAPLALFVSRRARAALFVITTPFQFLIIATANYGFLNCIVLALGLLLLDDTTCARAGFRVPVHPPLATPGSPLSRALHRGGLFAAALFLLATIEIFPGVPTRSLPAFLTLPARLLAPFRVANRYGLFAVMTTARYEIEFQGSRDGKEWIPYPFRWKPQALDEAPRFFVPHQPRFDWNLWFASLGDPRSYPWVFEAEARLLLGSAPVLHLFAGDPFRGEPPSHLRAMLWKYRFTTLAEHRASGDYWRRELIGPYGPGLVRASDGTIEIQH